MTTYIVTHGPSGKTLLVEAANQAQALRHVVRSQYFVAVASASDAIRLLKEGVQAETAGGETAKAES